MSRRYLGYLLKNVPWLITFKVFAKYAYGSEYGKKGLSSKYCKNSNSADADHDDIIIGNTPCSVKVNI